MRLWRPTRCVRKAQVRHRHALLLSPKHEQQLKHETLVATLALTWRRRSHVTLTVTSRESRHSGAWLCSDEGICAEDSAPHRAIGWVWVRPMLMVSVSGFFIYELRIWGRWSSFHLLVMFTLLMLPRAVGVRISTMSDDIVARCSVFSSERLPLRVPVYNGARPFDACGDLRQPPITPARDRCRARPYPSSPAESASSCAFPSAYLHPRCRIRDLRASRLPTNPSRLDQVRR
jgi:hypothetical protein